MGFPDLSFRLSQTRPSPLRSIFQGGESKLVVANGFTTITTLQLAVLVCSRGVGQSPPVWMPMDAVAEAHIVTCWTNQSELQVETSGVHPLLPSAAEVGGSLHPEVTAMLPPLKIVVTSMFEKHFSQISRLTCWRSLCWPALTVGAHCVGCRCVGCHCWRPLCWLSLCWRPLCWLSLVIKGAGPSPI